MIFNAWLLLGSDRMYIDQIESILYLFLYFFKYMFFSRFLFPVLYKRSRSTLAECHLDYDQFTAVNIYFTLGPAQVYNISDHCFVAKLVGF